MCGSDSGNNGGESPRDISKVKEVSPNMATKISPLGDRLLVERHESSEQKSTGGIIIPDTAKERPTEGSVIAVGEGKRLDSGKLAAPSVKAGDRILFGKWSGTEVKIDGKEFIIMREEDVLAVLLPD